MRATEKRCYAALLLLFLFFMTMAEAQPAPPQDNNLYPYANFSPSVAVIISILVAAFCFIGFFSIYIRHCSDSSSSVVGRALSLRSLRRAAARGLDASVIENFPTFSYSEVKDHKIGKGALECAVCLNEFEEDETLRLLPKCDHVFHPECIDAWLQSHVTCPVCRANLVPQPGEDEPGRIPDSSSDNDHEEIIDENDVVRSDSRNEEIVIQVDEGRSTPVSRNSSFENPNRPPRPWSMGMRKFRSHSTGHSLVQPGENVDRFTLRLPEGVRKEVMDRAKLNRTRSFAAGLPSSTRGYRTGGEEGSNRVGRIYQRIELSGSEVKSDRWGFFTGGLSLRSPRVRTETGEGSGSKRGGSRTPTKMPSFKCLEPKADAEDENRHLSGQPPV